MGMLWGPLALGRIWRYAPVLLLVACEANLGDSAALVDARAGNPDAAQLPADAPLGPDAAPPVDAAPPADAQPCVEGDDRLIGATTGNCYIYIAAADTWDGAQASCVGLGAHLAVSTSQPENDDFSPLAGLLDVWVGGQDEIEDLWTWVNGETMGYTNWRSGEPNNGNGGYEEDCMIIEGDNGGLWDDRPCTSTYGFICEREQ